MFHYHNALGILCNVGEVNIFEHGRYISALEHVRMLILRSYSSARIYKHNLEILSHLDDLDGQYLSF